MNRATITTMIIMSSLTSLPALAGEKVDQSLPASDDAYVKIEHQNGSAEIRGWNKSEVRVEGELGDRTKEFTFESKGREIIIEVEVEKKGWGGWGNNNGDGDDLIIYVPTGASINYESINASLNISDITGDVEVEVVNGSVDASDIGGRTEIDSVNGSIEVQDMTGPVTIGTVNGSIRADHEANSDLNVESVNGSIRVKSMSEEVQAETVNGDIELELGSIEELEVSTVNGDIEVELSLQDNGDVSASTVGGGIELVFTNDVSARFEIEGHAGGRIVNRLTDDKMQKAKYGPRRWLNFTTGSGSARVDVSSVSGRVELKSK